MFYCHWKSVTPEKFQVERKGGIGAKEPGGLGLSTSRRSKLCFSAKVSDHVMTVFEADTNEFT